MHNSLDNRSRFLDHAGVDLLVRMMDAHKASATIQRQICWTILTLAGRYWLVLTKNPIDNLLTITLALSKYHIETPFLPYRYALLKCPIDIPLQIYPADFFVISIYYSHPFTGSDDASRAVVEAGGASAIVNAMVQHRNDPGVQQFGCWALGNLALSGDDNRRKLKKVGALEVSRMAIEHHADDTEVLRQARQLITMLGAK